MAANDSSTRRTPRASHQSLPFGVRRLPHPAKRPAPRTNRQTIGERGRTASRRLRNRLYARNRDRVIGRLRHRACLLIIQRNRLLQTCNGFIDLASQLSRDLLAITEGHFLQRCVDLIERNARSSGPPLPALVGDAGIFWTLRRASSNRSRRDKHSARRRARPTAHLA